LVLRGKERHELACSACAAPIHVMKTMPRDPKVRVETQPVSHRKPPKSKHSYKDTAPRKPSKRKRKASLLSWVLDEAKDAIEDIFD
jgi:hypothetical protein